MKKALLITILIPLVTVAAFALEVNFAHIVFSRESESKVENFNIRLDATLNGYSFNEDNTPSGINFSDINLKKGPVIELSVGDALFTNWTNAESVVETQIYSQGNGTISTGKVFASWVYADKVSAIVCQSVACARREDELCNVICLKEIFDLLRS